MAEYGLPVLLLRGIVDPRHLPETAGGPPVQLAQLTVTVKAVRYPIPLMLHCLLQIAAVDYTHASFFADPGQVASAYKLKGYDQAEMDAGPSAFVRPIKHQSAPRRYRFRVIAGTTIGLGK